MPDAYLYKIDYAVSTNAPWRDAHQVTDGVTEDDPPVPVPVDLTGSIWTAHFRRQATDLAPIFVASTANGYQDVDEDGLLAWDVPASILAAIGPCTLVYDRLWQRLDGVIVPFATGTLTISLGITRT